MISDEYLAGLILKLVSPVCSFWGLHCITQENCNIFSSHLSNICVILLHFLSGIYTCNILSPITAILLAKATLFFNLVLTPQSKGNSERCEHFLKFIEIEVVLVIDGAPFIRESLKVSCEPHRLLM